MMRFTRIAMKLAPALKPMIWRDIVTGHLDWRSLEYLQKAHFGAEFAGNTSDVIQRYIYFFGCWEPQVEAVIECYLGHADTFIDVGANIGYFTLFAAHKVGSRGRVYAFEASRKIFDRLVENIERNGLSGIVRPVHVAVADKKRTLTLYSGPEENCGMASVLRNEGMSEETVEALPLGQLLTDEVLVSARLIKVDVEGAEELIIRGFEPDLHRFRGDLLVELNPALSGVQQVIDILEQTGRHPYQILPPDSIENYLRPPRTACVRPLARNLSTRCDVLFSAHGPDVLERLGIHCLEANEPVHSGNLVR